MMFVTVQQGAGAERSKRDMGTFTEETALSTDERADLARHEALIEAHKRSFIRVGEALLDIRDRRLYRETHRTWADYCQERWGFVGRRGEQLIAAFTVAQSITNNSHEPLPEPEKEGQLRPLVSLPEDEAVQVWRDATEVYGPSPTGSQVAAVAERRQDADAAPEVDPIRRQVYASKLVPIIQRMNTGELTPDDALCLADVLRGCEPIVRGDMLLSEVTDTAVIREMNRLYKRQSETYFDIVNSGYLQDGETARKITEMTPRDLRNFLNRKSDEKRQAAIERKHLLIDEGATVVEVGDDGTVTFKVSVDTSGLRPGQTYQLKVRQPFV